MALVTGQLGPDTQEKELLPLPGRHQVHLIDSLALIEFLYPDCLERGKVYHSKPTARALLDGLCLNISILETVAMVMAKVQVSLNHEEVLLQGIHKYLSGRVLSLNLVSWVQREALAIALDYLIVFGLGFLDGLRRMVRVDRVCLE